MKRLLKGQNDIGHTDKWFGLGCARKGVCVTGPLGLHLAYALGHIHDDTPTQITIVQDTFIQNKSNNILKGQQKGPYSLYK